MLNFHIPGDRGAIVVAASRERARLSTKALAEARRESDGYKRELAEANEKVRVLEAKLTTARSELLKAIHAKPLSEARGDRA